MVFGVAISGFVLLTGWFLLYTTVVWYRQRSLIADTPTSTVRSLALGRVELEGVAEPVDGPFETPFSATPAVLYWYSIDDYHENGDGHDEWVTVESGARMAPFYLNDGTGRVLVDPDDADFDVRETVVEVDEGEDDPEEVARFLDERADRFDAVGADGATPGGVATFGPEADGVRVGDASDLVAERRRRRYVEKFLPAGEEAYVFGKAMERESVPSDSGPDVVVGNADDIPSFSISHRSEAAVLAEKTKSVRAFAAFGLVFAGMGFLGLLAAAGPLLGVVLAALSLGVAYALREVFDRAQFVSSS